MTAPDMPGVFRQSLAVVMGEIFERVQAGFFLDPGTSLFETLATVSAAEAARPVSARRASIAGQVGHVQFALEEAPRFARGESDGPADRAASWRRAEVTPDEWAALQGQVRAAYQEMMALMRDDRTWQSPNAIGGAMVLVAHRAYHLGEIRQALGVVRDE
jgi:hypothetical protein